jgi:hypothetical protein
MDPIAFLSATPVAGIIPYLTFILAVATAALLVLPAPTPPCSRFYSGFYGTVHLVANLRPAPPAAKPTPTSMPIATLLGCLLAVSLVSACTLTPSQQAAVRVACNVDGLLVPIAQPVLLALMPSTAGAVAADQALVHPIVVSLCAGLGGTPASVTTAK